jgi:uncharacterized protein DUF268
VTAEAPIARRVKRVGARALALAGGVALQASNRLVEQDGVPDLQGDRVLEWSFCLARLADGPGTTLDFGADVAFLSLAAAQRGHDVVALDRMPSSRDYEHERVEFVQADILDRPLQDRVFDQILNCSSVEHVGLSGRYGSGGAPDGDLEAMRFMRELLAAEGRMVLTIPVGRDLVCAPFHRIYGEQRLPLLLEPYRLEEEQYWRKDPATRKWARCDRDAALETQGSEAFYSLGLFVLAGR